MAEMESLRQIANRRIAEHRDRRTTELMQQFWVHNFHNLLTDDDLALLADLKIAVLPPQPIKMPF